MSSAQSTFEALVNAYSADLYRYAYWLCQQSNLAEDMVQETFMRAWKALDSLQDPNAAKSWLFTILRRELARYYSKNSKEQNRLISYDSEEELDGWLDVEPGNQPLEIWTLHQALNKLPLEYREPLVLQVLGGYSCDEIGTMLQTSSGAVMTRLSRARQKMRKLLAHDKPLSSKKVK